MAIVLPCPMSARDYAAAGRELELSRPNCPRCQGEMSFWGWYTRPLRIGEELRIAIRRVRCSNCCVSHGLIPEFVTFGRLDGVEVIGEALEQMAAGTSTAIMAEKSCVPFTTARGWRRRFAARADLLARGLLAAAVALGELVPRLPAGAVQIALCAIETVGASLSRRSGGGGRWRVANRIAGGHLLSTNTDPPWMAA